MESTSERYAGRFAFLAVFASLVLVVAAVTLGGLNQDEGWYVYAAQLTGEGKMPYRDFSFTQAPLMPVVYSLFSFSWEAAGILGVRALTAVFGLAGCVLAAVLARLLASEEKRTAAAVAAFLLLACNLYHVYYVSIPKTYALASVFVAGGFCLFAKAVLSDGARRNAFAFASGAVLALATGTRISLGALLAVGGFALLFGFRRHRWAFLWFGLGGLLVLAAVYGPFLCDEGAFAGLVSAQKYHASRAGFSPVFAIGSLSRLVRWYLPVFILLGLGVGRIEKSPRRFAVFAVFAAFLSVFLVQMLAPFPYEDYQVPVMALLAAAVAALASARIEREGRFLLLTLGLSFATSFGSPLLEKWMTDGQDRFWTLFKEKPEIFLLKDAARIVEALDPGGETILTQDLYLAVEAGRKVPAGLEMGPFSVLSPDEWRRLLETCDAPVAALSGYSFSIEPPRCAERDKEEQRAFRAIVERRYGRVSAMERFGQNATALELFKRRDAQ